LLVEDDRDIAQMYRLKLEREGWEVELALDGETGLAMLKDRRPDILLLDLMLPGIDGFELLAAIRGDPSTRDLPVVVVSNSAGTAGKLDRARTLGVLDWLTKSSTSPSALAARLDELLPRS
jgi:DNA-binding response OmpR family regulator